MNRTSARFNYILLRAAIIITAVLTICACLFACDRTAPPEKVTFAYTVLPDSALAQIATANDYYKLEGLAVTPQVHQIGKQALQAVLDGKADFATVAETPVMFSIMNGDKISVIATIDTSNKNMALAARKDRGISAIGDLRGKKAATTFGTIGEFFLDTLLLTRGIKRKEVNVINLPPDKLHDALINGDVDVISAWNPILSRAQEKLGEDGVTLYGDDLYTQFYVVVAREEYIRKNPSNVLKLLKALVRAEEFIGADPAEAQNIAAKGGKTDISLVKATWSANNFRLALDQSLILALEEESRWAMKNGLTKAANIPNYLDYIYFDGLKSVKPEAVRILR